MQAFSGNRPFHNLRPNAIIIAVTQGRRPVRPSNEVCQTTGLVHGVWSLIESCWDQQPTRRPKASNIVEGLRSILGVVNEQRPSDWDDSFILQLRSNLGQPGGARSLSMDGDLNSQSTSSLTPYGQNSLSTLVDLNARPIPLLARILAATRNKETSALNTLRGHHYDRGNHKHPSALFPKLSSVGGELEIALHARQLAVGSARLHEKLRA